VALRDESGGGAGLGSRSLLVKQKLSAGAVGAGASEVDDDLQREHELAV
jgi:hypothetical protein